MSIRLVVPTREHEEKAIDFKNEFIRNGETVINGSEMLDHIEEYDIWLASVTNNAKKETVNPDWVLTDTFFALDDNDKIIGTQSYSCLLDGTKKSVDNFVKNISKARTFGKYSEWEYLKKHGMGRGANEHNVIALNNEGDETLNKLSNIIIK